MMMGSAANVTSIDPTLLTTPRVRAAGFMVEKPFAVERTAANTAIAENFMVIDE